MLAGILLLSFGLCLAMLGKDLGLDEASSVQISQLDWGVFGELLWRQQANMSLYYLLLRFWIQVGDSEVTIRLLSVLPALAAVPALFSLGSKLFGPRVGLTAAFLLSINAFHIRYAQEARSYSLLELLAILSTYSLIRFIERPDSRYGALYAASSILSVYAHFFGLFVLAAQWLSLVLMRRRHLSRALISYGGATALSLVPVAAFLLKADPSIVDWIPPPSPSRVFYLVYAFVGGVEVGVSKVLSSGGAVLLIAYLFICLVGLFVLIRAATATGLTDSAWRSALIVAWLFLPIALSLFVSAALHPIFEKKYLIVSLPAFVLAASVGLSRLGRTARTLVVVLILAGSLMQLARYYTVFGKGGWRSATRHILHRADSEDTVIFYPVYLQQPFDYYRSRLGLNNRRVALLRNWDWAKVAKGGMGGSELTAENARALARTSRSVWVMSRDQDPTEQRVEPILSCRFVRFDDWDFSGIRVFEYRRIEK